MKKVLLAAGILVLLVVAAAFVLPGLVSLDSWKGEIAARIGEATGRPVRIDGPIRLSVLPRLELDVAGVGLGNAAGREPAEIVSVAKLRLALKLLPLLSGEVAIDRFVLDHPVVALEVDAKGKANWDFGTATEAPAATGTPAASGRFSQLRLDDVHLVDGSITWTDRRSGTQQSVSGVDLEVSLPGLDGPLAARGNLVFRGRKVALDVGVARTRSLLDGQATPLRARIDADMLKLDFRGDLPSGATRKLRGDVDLEVPSVPDFASWLGTRSVAFGTLRIHGKLDVTDAKVSFSNASVSIDAIRGAGAVSFDFAGTKRLVEGRLSIDELDLSPYLAATPGPGGSDAPKKSPSTWSDAPIDLGSLRAADGNFDITLGAVRAGQLRIDKTVLDAKLSNGQLSVALDPLALYGGSGNAKLVLDGARSDSAGVAFDAHLRGVAVEPLLRDAAASNRVSGSASVDVSLSSRGSSERDLVGGLDGNGNLELRDGAVRGINLGEMVMHVASAFTLGNADAKTEFSEMRGSFTVTGGVLKNSDATLTSPLLVVAGEGTVDLNSRSVDYRVTPKVVASGLSRALGGLGVATPVRIRGPWDNLRYEPDVAGFVEQVPNALIDTTRGLTKLPGSILRGATGSPPAGTTGDAPAKPKSSNPLKRLFGR